MMSPIRFGAMLGLVLIWPAIPARSQEPPGSPDPPPSAPEAPAPEAPPAPIAPEPQRGSLIGELWGGLFKGSDAAPQIETSPAEGSAGGGIASYLPPPARRFVEKYNIRAALIGDFAYEGLDARDRQSDDFKHLLMREMEVSLAADLSSSIRADMIYSVGREGSHFNSGFEEVYLTFLDLPLDFQARVGKFKAAFGKANQMHTHARPWIDIPAAQNNFFGDSLSGTGVSLSHLIPNPWNVYSELILQVFDVNAGSEFAARPARGLTEVAHWKNVFDLTPESTLEAGLSAAYVPQKSGGHGTAEGVDLTYKWRPAEQGLYRSVVWINEFYAIQNDVDSGGKGAFFGAYTSFEYQFARRWSAGLRLDFSQVPDQSSNEYGAAPFITFRQTERLLYRLQFNHIENDPDHEGRSSNDIRVQFDFSLGSHAPHMY